MDFPSPSHLGLPSMLAFMTALVAVLAWNLFRQIRARRRLQDQKERADLLLDSAAEAIYCVDPQGLCTFCNPAALRLLGYRKQSDLLGKNIHDLIHHTLPDGQPHPAESCRIMSIAREPAGVHLQDEILWRADGTSFPAEVWSHPVRQKEKTIGAIVTFLDISERQAAEAKSEEAKRELNAFAYTVSHDLRTPLTAIIGYAEFLQARLAAEGDETVRMALAEIQAQGERMSAMMEDLLDLAQVGEIERPEAPVDTAAVVETVLRDMAEPIADAGVAIHQEPLPQARIPETLLTQVFANLLGNAVRYAGKAGGVIEVGGLRKAHKVCYFVRDHGPGVPEPERERIFNLFQRGAAGKGLAGTGIGLATVAKIAQKQHGRAWVEETPGGGATFWVEMVDERRTDSTRSSPDRSKPHRS